MRNEDVRVERLMGVLLFPMVGVAKAFPERDVDVECASIGPCCQVISRISVSKGAVLSSERTADVDWDNPVESGTHFSAETVRSSAEEGCDFFCAEDLQNRFELLFQRFQRLSRLLAVRIERLLTHGRLINRSLAVSKLR